MMTRRLLIALCVVLGAFVANSLFVFAQTERMVIPYTMRADSQDGFVFENSLQDSMGDGDALTPMLAGAGAGNLSNGVYRYKFTMAQYVGNNTYEGETAGGTPTPTVTVTDNTTDGKVTVQLPYTCDQASSERVYIYRTAANGSTYKRVDNSEHLACGRTFTDNVADASLGTALPSTNTALGTRLTLVNNSLVGTIGDGFDDEVINIGNPATSGGGVEIITNPSRTPNANGDHLTISAAGSVGTGRGGNLTLRSGYGGFFGEGTPGDVYIQGALGTGNVNFFAADIKPTLGGYLYLHTTAKTAAPAGGDCDASGETNRIAYDSTNDNLYICSGASGWRKIGTAAP